MCPSSRSGVTDCGRAVSKAMEEKVGTLGRLEHQSEGSSRGRVARQDVDGKTLADGPDVDGT